MLERCLDLFLRRFVDVQRERFSVVGYGGVILTDKSECVAPAVEGRPVIGDQPDGLAVVRNGAVVLPPSRVSIATVLEGCGIVWIKPDRLVVVLNRPVLIPPLVQVGIEIPSRFVLIREGATEEGRGEIGIDRNRLIAIRNRVIEPPLDAVDNRSIDKRQCVFGIEPNGLVIILDGAVG